MLHRRRRLALGAAAAGRAWRAARARGRTRWWRLSAARSDRLRRTRRLDVAVRRQDVERMVGRSVLEGGGWRDRHRIHVRKANRHGVPRLAGGRSGRLRAEARDERHWEHQRRGAVSRLDRAAAATWGASAYAECGGRASCPTRTSGGGTRRAGRRPRTAGTLSERRTARNPPPSEDR